MKTSTPFGKHGDHWFHMPPTSVTFSFITSFVLVLLGVLFLLAIPSR
jgi:hypothetical protein